MAICSSSASSEEHWNSVPQRPTDGADGAGERVRPGVAGDALRGLDLVEAEADGDRGVGGELERVVLGVGDVALVSRRAAGAHLRVGEGDLERGEVADDLGEPGRGQAVGEADELGARHGHVDEHAGELEGGDRHRLGRHLRVEVVGWR